MLNSCPLAPRPLNLQCPVLVTPKIKKRKTQTDKQTNVACQSSPAAAHSREKTRLLPVRSTYTLTACNDSSHPTSTIYHPPSIEDPEPRTRREQTEAQTRMRDGLRKEKRKNSRSRGGSSTMLTPLTPRPGLPNYYEFLL